MIYFFGYDVELEVSVLSSGKQVRTVYLKALVCALRHDRGQTGARVLESGTSVIVSISIKHSGHRQLRTDTPVILFNLACYSFATSTSF